MAIVANEILFGNSLFLCWFSVPHAIPASQEFVLGIKLLLEGLFLFICIFLNYIFHVYGFLLLSPSLFLIWFS